MRTSELGQSKPRISVKTAAALRAYLLALAACGLTAVVAMPLRDWLDLANTAMLFLLAVALVAVRLGRGPAVLAAFFSVALFDFLFVPPRLTFAVADVQYLVTFAVMLAVALIIGHLTTGLARQAHAAEARERQTRSLYELAKSLAGAMALTQVRSACADFLSENLHADAALLLPDDKGELHTVDAAKETMTLAASYSARTVYGSGEAGEGEHFEGGAGHSLFLPLRGSTRMRGVLVVSVAGGEEEVLHEQRHLLQAVASLAAIAVERLHFVEVAQSTQLQINSERLRSSILSALSHDVRTPLTVMYGLADTLAASASEPARETAIGIRDQALRLNNMVGNLLDMARLQAGEVRLRREWQPLEEVIGASIKLMGPVLEGHAVKVDLPPGLPLLEFDAVLMERVFCNLLENAAKYSPVSAAIEVRAQLRDSMVETTVCNQGPGFPVDKIDRVFGLFERGSMESAIPGFGIGLAICRAIVEAHGGGIRAFNPEGGGACVSFTLPRGTPPQIESELAAGDDQ